MKISPAPSLGVASADAQTSKVQSIRALKMATNATPLATPPPAINEPEPLISPNNEDNSNPTVEATQPISPQFAALAKQKRALQQEKRAFEEEKKAFLAKSQGSDQVDMTRLKTDAIGFLLERGVTYEQLTDEILSRQNNPEIRTLESKIASLQEGVEKRLQDRDTQAEQQLYAEVSRDAKSIIATKPDDFELVNKMNRVPIAVEVWKREYKETGEFPDMEGILRDVEDHCLKECQEFTALKKIQALFPKQAPEPMQRPQGMRTLTNKDTASVPMGRRERALAAALGTLKK